MDGIQAAVARGIYGAFPMAERDSMLYWLSKVAREQREAGERKQVHVAASANVDQSTIWRFEQGTSWTRDIDATIAAYADDLGMTPIEIWTHAVNLWHADDATEPVGGAPQAPTGELARRLQDAPTNQQSPASTQTPKAGDDLAGSGA